MKEIIFQVAFLSDIVLPASSNTEGNIENLDFIPGSNFLGIAAKSYSKFNDSFAIFHSGAVRFGDATFLCGEKETYKMPLSFFHEKLDDTKMVNHHHINDFSDFEQLKQYRKGYITEGLEAVEIEYNYAQKSAYDKENRRSKDSSMYGYYAIPAGTKWQFTLKYDGISDEDLATLKNNLLGARRLGKSKSSQYGQIHISESQKAKSVNCSKAGQEIHLYAKSRLALVDHEGMPTYDLKCLTDGLRDENVVWEKTQIKTSAFTPYNGAMQTKTYERIVINSGSVIVLKDISDEQLTTLQSGVGVYLSEGFGELLVNPDFLEIKDMFSFKESPKDAKHEKEKITSPIAAFLLKKEKEKNEQLDIASNVNKFILDHKKLYKQISNAQWGTIRSICTSPVKDFKQEIRDYISDGKVTWSTEQIETLLEESNSRTFIKLLSMQMPKIKKEN